MAAANNNPENFSANESEFSEPDFNITPIHTKISPIIRAVERLIITANDAPVKKYFERVLTKFQIAFGKLSPSDEDFSLECYGIIHHLNNGVCDGARALTFEVPFLYNALYGFIERCHTLCRAAIVEYDYCCGAIEWYDTLPPINEQDLSVGENKNARHLPIFDDELDYMDPLAIFLRELTVIQSRYVMERVHAQSEIRRNTPATAPAHVRPADADDDEVWQQDKKKRKSDF